MAKKLISIQKDSLERASIVRPILALAEIIWNSLDADANNVDVMIALDDIKNQYLSVIDDGSGISYDIATKYFSQLGGSWKSKKNLTENSRGMHGRKGEGRLKAFSIGQSLEWETVYQNNNKFYSYSISSSFSNIKEVEIQEPKELSEAKNGTKLVIRDFHDETTKANGIGDINKVIEELTALFSPYLITYTDIDIFVNKHRLDPKEYLIDAPLELKIQVGGNEATLTIILWNKVKDNKLYLCKSNRATICPYIGTLTSKLNAKGYRFSAYLSSELFEDDIVQICDLDPQICDLIEEAVKQLNVCFNNKKIEENLRIKEKWIEDDIYPYEVKENNELSSIEAVKRDVFDICAVQVENNIPKFKDNNKETRRFTFRLLAQTLEDNPSAIRRIITEVLNLSKEDQEMFAELLEKMKLPAIIETAKLVSDRLIFLNALNTLIFDHKKSLLERDQLHKILEKEAWIFDENFALSASEKNLTDTLKVHLGHLGERNDNVEFSDIADSKGLCRVDLMLSKAISPSIGHKNYLIVELKRPLKTIDRKVLDQIEDYALAVISSERFDKSKSSWKFIAVSNEIGGNIKHRLKDGKVIYNDDAMPNTEIYVMTWAEVISNAHARLTFIQKSLQYEVQDEQEMSYLKAKHGDYLPSSCLDDPSQSINAS